MKSKRLCEEQSRGGELRTLMLKTCGAAVLVLRTEALVDTEGASEVLWKILAC